MTRIKFLVLSALLALLSLSIPAFAAEGPATEVAAHSAAAAQPTQAQAEQALAEFRSEIGWAHSDSAGIRNFSAPEVAVLDGWFSLSPAQRAASGYEFNFTLAPHGNGWQVNQAGVSSVQKGGTGLYTIADTGILFASATDTLAVDATNFKWIDTSNGQYLQLGAGTTAGTLKLLEGSGGGTDAGSIVANSTLGAARTWTMPDATGIVALVTSALTPASVAATGAITTSSAAAGTFGIATGAGGTVTQITTAATGVTLVPNPCRGGHIVTVTQNIAAAGEVTFVVTNSAVGTTDAVFVWVDADTTVDGTPQAYVSAIGAGTFDITITNNHASVAEQGILTIGFFVLDNVTS